MKFIQSFDALLLVLLLVISLCFLSAGFNMGLVVYFGMAVAGALLIRNVMGVQTLEEAVSWLRDRARLAFYLGFVWTANLVYLVFAYQNGYVSFIEAIGFYPFLGVVFSALVMLQHRAWQQVLKLFGHTR